jgi:dTDP-4-amino-4,6-dideoxygalactose transaminase
MENYNSWPLGKLPINWQRSEPNQIKQSGYYWDDPRDIITIFEKKLAEYAGSKYAVVTDCCSHALFLSLAYKNIKEEVIIPDNTYVSVPMQILHVGSTPVFNRIHWTGIYQLGETNIFDSAARFTRDMYVGNGALQLLSFQIKKILPIGRGGAILTDSNEAYEWLKLATYDGRDLKTKYNSSAHVKMLGWHYYMTPEDAARGILIMDQLPEINSDSMSWENYPCLSDMDFFRDYPKIEI